jgi:FHA domain
MMDIICQNSNCKKTIQINGPWIAHAACSHCGRINYRPFTYSDELSLPDVSPPIPPKPIDNEPAGGNWRDQRRNPTPDPPRVIPPMATLMSEDNLGKRQEFKLKLGINVIGRATPMMQVDVVLMDDSLSRPHCVVEVLDNKFYGWKYLLYDISYMNRKESTNGVYIALRSTRLGSMEQVELQVGDYFITGHVRFELR